MINSFIILTFVSCGSCSLYDNFLLRLNEYKERTLQHSGCGWWQDILRIHYSHDHFCENGLLNTAMKVDDFHMAGVAWILMREWANPGLTNEVQNTLLSRLTSIPWWLDETGMLTNMLTNIIKVSEVPNIL